MACVWGDEYSMYRRAVAIWHLSYSVGLFLSVSPLIPHVKKTDFDTPVVHRRVFFFFLQFPASLVSRPWATGRVVAMEFWHRFINENRWVWEVNMGWSRWRVLWEEKKWTPLYRNNLHLPLSHTRVYTHTHTRMPTPVQIHLSACVGTRVTSRDSLR